MSGLDVSFSELGNVTGLQDVVDEGTGLTSYNFINGNVIESSTESSLTSNYAFVYDPFYTTAGEDGYVDSATLFRFQSRSTGTNANEDLGSVGWEIGFDYDGGRFGKIKWGISGGLAINAFDAKHTASFESDLYRETADIDLSGTEITYVEGDTYVGGDEGPVIDIDTDYTPNPDGYEPVQQEIFQNGQIVVVDVPAMIDGSYEIDGILGSFHIGPIVEVPLGRKLKIQAGGGLSATYFSSTFTSDQTITNAGVVGGYNELLIGDAEGWLIGQYGELNVIYQFNERMNVYFGIQFQQSDNYQHLLESGVSAEVSTESWFLMHGGMNVQY